ncbi:hypothetical protein IQ255_05670 [Pleurocapsales cyanobacterium LEGE 10410]|nr:hypothetical protein [Pleurocapsales cyanobacterium LEGE 10410]
MKTEDVAHLVKMKLSTTVANLCANQYQKANELYALHTIYSIIYNFTKKPSAAVNYP